MNKYIEILNKRRNSIITLVFTLLLGFTAWQVSHIFNVTPDPAAIEAKKAEGKNATLRINTEILQKLEDSLRIDVNTDPGATGKSDPFNP